MRVEQTPRQELTVEKSMTWEVQVFENSVQRGMGGYREGYQIVW